MNTILSFIIIGGSLYGFILSNDHDFWVGDDLCSVCFKGIIARPERKREGK